LNVNTKQLSWWNLFNAKNRGRSVVRSDSRIIKYNFHMPVCFPSMAPMTCGKFHWFWKPRATSFQPSGVVGQTRTSEEYSSMMAWHTSGMNMLMVLKATLKEYASDLQLSPVARYLRVKASFSPGGKAFLKKMSCSDRQITYQIKS